MFQEIHLNAKEIALHCIMGSLINKNKNIYSNIL